MARPRKPLDAERESRLLLVAAEAFLADGFDRASLNRIIDEAGIAKSSFYHYFADKRALYDHLLEFLSAHLLAPTIGLDLAALTRENFWGALHGSLREMAAAPADAQVMLALARLFHARAEVDDGFAGLRSRLLEGLAVVLRRGRELGAVRADLPLDLVVEIAWAWLLAVDRWAVARPASESGPSASTAPAADRALTILCSALEAP